MEVDGTMVILGSFIGGPMLTCWVATIFSSIVCEQGCGCDEVIRGRDSPWTSTLPDAPEFTCLCCCIVAVVGSASRCDMPVVCRMLLTEGAGLPERGEASAGDAAAALTTCFIKIC